jgi:dTDP-4-amino-4,6-dideoxygalactose transaminase
MLLFKTISRGIIYQPLLHNIFYFFSSFFSKINDKKKIKEFEDKAAKYVGVNYCVAFPFARMGLYYALKLQNYAPGTKIIITPITIPEIIEVILNLGLEPVFVDIELNTLCIDTELLEKNIDGNTKAILITYLYGITPNINKILEITDKYNLFVVEDFSHNFNAKFKGKMLGTFGDVSIFSSSFTKTFDLFGGGITFTNNKEIYKNLIKNQEKQNKVSRKFLINKILKNLLYNFFTNRIIFSLLTFYLIKIRNKFFNKTSQEISTHINKFPKEWLSPFTSFQASIGIKTIKNISNTDNIRINNVKFLKTFIKSQKISFPVDIEHTSNIYWQFIAFTKDVTKIQNYLLEYKIDVTGCSLPVCSNIKSFSVYRYNTPNAEYLKKHSFFIPAYHKLSRNDLIRLTERINNFV